MIDSAMVATFGGRLAMWILIYVIATIILGIIVLVARKCLLSKRDIHNPIQSVEAGPLKLQFKKDGDEDAVVELAEHIEERRSIDERIFAYSDFARKTDNRLYIRLKEIEKEVCEINKVAEDHTTTFVGNFIIKLKRLNHILYNAGRTSLQVAEQDRNFNILCRGEAPYAIHKELWRIYTVNHLKEMPEKLYDARMADNFQTLKNLVFDIFSTDWNTDNYKFETFRVESEKHMNTCMTEFLVLMERYGSLSVAKRELEEEAKRLPDETEAKIQEVKVHIRETGKLPDYAL